MSFLEEFNDFMWEHGISGGFTPVPVSARSEAEARAQQSELQALVGQTSFVAEDRWRSRPEQMRARILAHAGVFTQVYARNCELRRIDKPTAAAFLKESHDYADALCRYRYGLFLKHLTGEKQYGSAVPAAEHPTILTSSAAAILLSSTTASANAAVPHYASGASAISSAAAPVLEPGTLVAVAEFSNLRNLDLDGTRSRSCQWIRYASLPGVRVEGGMGKVLQGLIKDADPDDVMTYADLEWSDGRAYRALGFEFIDYRRPVLFRIDPLTWQRTAIDSRKGISPSRELSSPARNLNESVPYAGSGSGSGSALTPPEDARCSTGTHLLSFEDACLWYLNFGSARYRLRLHNNPR